MGWMEEIVERSVERPFERYKLWTGTVMNQTKLTVMNEGDLETSEESKR